MQEKFYTWKTYLKKQFHDIKTYHYSRHLISPLILIYSHRLKKQGAYACLPYIDILTFFNKDTGSYCLAELYYYIGEFEKSIVLLDRLKVLYPKKEDVYYLQHKCYISLNRKAEALQVLQDLVTKSKRNKTWIFWANFVRNKDDYEVFKKNFLYHNKFEYICDISLINYYAEAALNASQYLEAINIWRSFRLNNEAYGSKSINSISKNISSDAKNALINFKSILDNQDINFFIISGTLLGCIRERKILSHDKDIDIGVFEEDINIDSLKLTIQKSGFFEIMPTKHDKYLKIKHLNGVFLDIFIHYRDENYYYHRTAKIEWKNKKFNLIKINFLNHDFLVPDNYNLYLDENYGYDWRVPKINFDSNFDTPNAKVVDSSAVEVFIEKLKTYQHFKLK